MDCPRCHGFVQPRPERHELETLWFHCCLNCGNVWDEQIEKNRAGIGEQPDRAHRFVILPTCVDVSN